MNAPAELRVHIGRGDQRLSGFMSMGLDESAEIPFEPGDDFPFEDRSVGALLIDVARGAPVRDRLAPFLLECRRVLKPGGLVRFVSVSDAAVADLLRLAPIIGLEPADKLAPDARFRLAMDDVATSETEARHDFSKRERRLMSDPLVSILIPAYNPRFFALSLESALAQTYSSIEIVVCDDSPGNEIEAMCRQCGSQGLVHYERNPRRLGPRPNFVRCFEKASGEFVKFLCDDDLLQPRCVATLLDAFRLAPDVVLATSHRQRIDEFGHRLDDQPATVSIVRRNTIIAGHTLANAMLVAGLNIVGEPSTALFRKTELTDRAPDYFRFSGEHGYGAIDMVTWTALLCKGDAVYFRESLSSFRIHAGQRQHDPAKLQRNIASIRGLQAAWLELGVSLRTSPGAILGKPFPASPGGDWRAMRVLGFDQRAIVPTSVQGGPIKLVDAAVR